MQAWSAVSPGKRRILVTGGAGYVGSALVPKLLASGHAVSVLDLYIYGDDIFADLADHAHLRQVKGDLRNVATVEAALKDCDTVIHLACISNDPSFELNPDLGRSINFDAFRPLVQAAKGAGVNRFIYASSSSVYGIKDEAEVTEDLSLEPLTDYSKYKAMCEDVLLQEQQPGFTCLTLRPATVCGYAPRLRLDLTVNILTNHAINKGAITVFGGSQTRPNINIEDMTDLYLKSLDYPDALIAGQIFNAGYENHAVSDLAAMVRAKVGPAVAVNTEPSNDLRSYRVSSQRISQHLGFTPQHSIEDAVQSLITAFDAGKVPDAMNDDRYYNVNRMQAIALQ